MMNRLWSTLGYSSRGTVCLSKAVTSNTRWYASPGFQQIPPDTARASVPDFKYTHGSNRRSESRILENTSEDLTTVGTVAQEFLGKEKFSMEGSLGLVFGNFNEIIKLFTLRNSHDGHPLLYLSQLLEAEARFHHADGSNPFPLWRAMMLLLATEMFGYSTKIKDVEAQNLITDRHKNMAKISEIAYVSQQLHKRILDSEDISALLKATKTTKQRQYLASVHNANKTATLIGDLLWAQTCSHMAALKCQTVSELICLFLMDYCESEFVFGVRKPGTEHFNVDSWLRKTQLAIGSILGTGMSSNLLFSGHSNEIRDAGYRLGVLLGLTYQAYDDIMYFKRDGLEVRTWIDMGLLPVIHKIHNDPHILNQPSFNIFQEVKNDDQVMNASKETLKILQEDTLEYLDQIKGYETSQKARDLLERFVVSLSPS